MPSRAEFNGARLSPGDRVHFSNEPAPLGINPQGTFTVAAVEPDFYWPEDDVCFYNETECIHGREWQKVTLVEMPERRFRNTELELVSG